MTEQAINTVNVAAAAERLSARNDNINDKFEILQKAAKRLESDWEGAAASAAHTTIYELFANNELRSNVIENYVITLTKLVNPNYEYAEEENIKLADYFK